MNDKHLLTDNKIEQFKTYINDKLKTELVVLQNVPNAKYYVRKEDYRQLE